METYKLKLPASADASAGALLRHAQTAAQEHLRALGVYDEAARQGLCWVIARTGAEIFSPALSASGMLTGETWATRARGGLCPRYFILTDADGKLLARTASLWVLADIRTRAFAPRAAVSVPEIVTGREFPLPKGVPPLPDAAEQLGVFTPDRAWIDENGHMNNAAYPDAVQALCGFAADAVRAFSVDYRREILPQAQVAVFAHRQDGETLLSGRGDGAEYFRMRLRLEK